MIGNIAYLCCTPLRVVILAHISRRMSIDEFRSTNWHNHKVLIVDCMCSSNKNVKIKLIVFLLSTFYLLFVVYDFCQFVVFIHM